ncbi:acyltransferase family protein [Duncaniella muris]|uniref:DUF418 domain-containing protein n=1 Tax=Duncaniella muris TaxID=2094150 RepID=A0A2V1IQP0_9BACT|nr:acyltransferase family protein [Duncaniella muris]PWB02502.1 DUF418 domain-containing protein [Duncaniella muris]
MALSKTDKSPINSKGRIIWLDIVKLFAIVLVVYGHCIQQFDGNYLESSLFVAIYSFHMPMFMMLSGYMLDYNKLLNWKGVLAKRLYQLIFPSIFWLTIAYVIKGALDISQLSLSRALWFGLWFLKSLFVCTILLVVPQQIFRHKYISLTISLILSQITVFIPHLWFLQLNVMLPSLMAGMFVKDIFVKSKKQTVIITIVSFIVFLFLLHSFDKDILYPNMFLMLSDNWIDQYYIQLYKLIIGISGGISILGLFKILFESAEIKIIKRLSALGRFTLEIYILQSLILEVLLSHYLEISPDNYGDYIWLIYISLSIIVIAISFCLAKILSRCGLDWTFNFNKIKSLCLKFQ